MWWTVKIRKTPVWHARLRGARASYAGLSMTRLRPYLGDSTSSEERDAWAFYDLLMHNMMEGDIVLVDPDGKEVCVGSAGPMRKKEGVK
jgi:hypothetical protein